MRVVIDTNVWISYFFWTDSTPCKAVKEIILDKSNQILCSDETYREFAEVIMRPKFNAYLPLVQRKEFLSRYSEQAKYVVVTERITCCRDPRDNKFLELAVAGRADIILSGDADLLALDPFQDIRILSPAELVNSADK